MMPKQKDMELPLLKTLRDFGGQAKANAVYPAMGAHFPDLTPTDIADELDSGGNKWTSRILVVERKYTPPMTTAKKSVMSAIYGKRRATARPCS